MLCSRNPIYYGLNRKQLASQAFVNCSLGLSNGPQYHRGLGLELPLIRQPSMGTFPPACLPGGVGSPILFFFKFLGSWFELPPLLELKFLLVSSSPLSVHLHPTSVENPYQLDWARIIPIFFNSKLEFIDVVTNDYLNIL